MEIKKQIEVLEKEISKTQGMKKNDTNRLKIEKMKDEIQKLKEGMKSQSPSDEIQKPKESKVTEIATVKTKEKVVETSKTKYKFINPEAQGTGMQLYFRTNKQLFLKYGEFCELTKEEYLQFSQWFIAHN